MTKSKQYKCVNCGEPAVALFKTYGPTVLKLTKCEKCKAIVDKYIEYDAVIVMIDLVLMSKEAQRHVLFNTEFKSYWKLLIILIMLETYGVWRSDSLVTIALNALCNIQSKTIMNSTLLGVPLNMSMPESWRNSCEVWTEEKVDDTDLFLWEKDFYIKFTSIFSGIVTFILTVQTSMQLLSQSRPVSSQTRVPLSRLLKAFSLGNASILLTLPMLVWGNADTSAETRALHYLLVFLYSFVLFVNVFTVLYECPTAITFIILSVSHLTKYSTSYYITSYLRTFVT